MTQASFIPITANDLQLYRAAAAGLLEQVEWTPAKNAKVAVATDPSERVYLPSGLDSTPQRASILEVAHLVAKDETLHPKGVNHALHAIQKGLTIGMHLGALYARTVGIEELRTNGKLSDLQQAEFANKLATAAAVATVATANYIVWELGSYRTDDVAAVSMKYDGLPELELKSPISARKCMIYYYASQAEKSGKVQHELDFVKFTLLYFKAVLAEVKLREGQLLYKEAFTDRKYKLDDCEFIVDGFRETQVRSALEAVTVNPITFAEIVGNMVAKHLSRRMIFALLSYNMRAKKNPFAHFGGFPRIRLLEGKPGTGKTLLLRAIATELIERCRHLKRRLILLPFPENIISTYQGGSAERALEWTRPQNNPEAIIYAWIDDAENVLEDASRQNVSSGAREVRGVLLRHSEGVSAPQYNNCVIEIATNYPEIIDKAVFSRVVSRLPIDGAVTANDYIDQDYLWHKKYEKIDPGFVNMAAPKGYAYLTDQRSLRNLGEGKRYLESQEDRIKKLVDAARGQYDINSHSFFGALFELITKRFPSFSSRDLRNIQTAVDARVMDFDMPDDWFDDPVRYLDQEYEVQLGMITELVKGNMKGLTFAQIRLEETLRYLDNTVRIADKDRERKIEALIKEREIFLEADHRAKLLAT